MTNKILYWVTVACAGLALLLFIANAALIRGNIRIQDEIGQRQSIINTAMTVSPINQQLSQALYEASVKNNDLKIQELLTQQGFKLPEKPAKAPEAKSSAKSKAKGEE